MESAQDLMIAFVSRRLLIGGLILLGLVAVYRVLRGLLRARRRKPYLTDFQTFFDLPVAPETPST